MWLKQCLYKIKSITAGYIWIIPFIFALVLLIFNTFPELLIKFKVKIDTTSLFLLAILLISPCIHDLKKIKFGDLEAEINRHEIEETKEEISAANIQTTLSEEEISEQPELTNIVCSIKNMFETDPILALAKLRIELEKIVNNLIESNVKQTNNLRGCRKSISMLLNELVKLEIITANVCVPCRQVITLCNRAIHGEKIDHDAAADIVEMGVSILIYLNNIFKLQSLNKKNVSL